MRNFLSIALAAAFTASSSAALTCGIDCVPESHSSKKHSAEHSASLHSLPAEHAHHATSEPVMADPILQMDSHACGNHVESQAVVSPKRIVRMDRIAVPGEISPKFLRAALPDFGARHTTPWRPGFPLSEPPSVTLRI